MKVLPFKIPKPKGDALVFQEDYETVLYDKLHQHEEIQISIVLHGEGTLIVGGTINHYKSGDILVIGSNIPHVFKSNPPEDMSKSHMLSVFFTTSSFGEDFFNLHELSTLSSFFKRSEAGFKVTSSKSKIKDLFLKIKSSTKIDRFLYFFKLLKKLSKTEYTSLSSFIYEKKYTDVEGKRMSNVFEYTIENFNQRITLDTIAMVATMSQNAFCKYFKKRTNKTYFQFLSEVRIEHACKLLEENKDLSITEIAEKSGFNNISNFNRKFKKIKERTPKEYRNFFR
ncbi:AraC family transcriptional regulator [Aquimarina rhabdastrellae]